MTYGIFHRGNVSQLDWNSIENGQGLRSFLEPLVLEGSQLYVANSRHEIQLLVAGGQVFPLVLSPGKNKVVASYIVSNLCQYFDYVQDEILRADSFTKGIKRLAKWCIPVARKLASALGMEKAVYVNNWLFSGNLYPNCQQVNWQEVVELLQQAFPAHALLFRSLDEKGVPEVKQALKLAGCHALSARLLYYLDFEETNLKKKRPFQQDKKRWEKQEAYEHRSIEMLSEELAQQTLTYYSELYIDKHSKYNPRYSLLMLQNLHKSGLLKFEGIFEGDVLRAVQLIWIRNGVATTPFIGYDQSIPSEQGLYRALNTVLTQLSQDAGALLNMSSGADRFKKQRGGSPVFEYNMLYYKHLKRHRQWVWKVFAWAGEKYIQPAMLAKAEK